jgi:hypothetical protein
MYYVYVYKHPKTKQPFYVGKGSGNRMYMHLQETKENTENYLKWCKIQSILNNGYRPIIDIVFESDDEESCYNEEKRLIEQYGRFVDGGILTNMCFDQRPPTYSAKLPRSEEYRKNMSIAKLGDKNGMYDKTPWNKGKELSNEHRRNIGISNKGRKYTKEEQEKRNQIRGKFWYILDPLGKEHVIQNLAKFAKENKLQKNNLRLALVGYNGKKFYKGYTGKQL